MRLDKALDAWKLSEKYNGRLETAVDAGVTRVWELGIPFPWHVGLFSSDTSSETWRILDIYFLVIKG